MEIQEVLKTNFVEALTKQICGDDVEIITRPAAFAVKKRLEDDHNIHRIILLPPRGYTANQINQTNCFHAVETATIQVKGAVKEGKNGLSKLKNSLLVVSFNDAESVSELDRPYMKFDMKENPPSFIKQIHSAGEPPFHVVKTDGTGFYHTLINTTDQWLVLELHKAMRPQKTVDIEPHLATLQDEQANTIRAFRDGILRHGDALFQKEEMLVQAVSHMPPQNILPALFEMLYIRDTGKHEPCTAFATILKVGKHHPEAVSYLLQRGLKTEALPSYFAQQLLGKIQKMPNAAPQRQIA